MDRFLDNWQVRAKIGGWSIGSEYDVWIKWREVIVQLEVKDKIKPKPSQFTRIEVKNGESFWYVRLEMGGILFVKLCCTLSSKSIK